MNRARAELRGDRLPGVEATHLVAGLLGDKHGQIVLHRCTLELGGDLQNELTNEIGVVRTVRLGQEPGDDRLEFGVELSG